MAIVESLVGDSGVRRYQWTRQSLEEALRLGALDPEVRYELIDGELYEKMGQNWPHMFASLALEAVFAGLDRQRFTVANQGSLILQEDRVPVPDLMVLQGGLREMRELPTPDRVLLLVEVSYSTLAMDRRVKLPRYAAAGIPVYWIVDVEKRRVEVHTRPEGDRYIEVRVYEPGGEIPPAFEGAPSVAVDGLFVPEG